MILFPLLPFSHDTSESARRLNLCFFVTLFLLLRNLSEFPFKHGKDAKLNGNAHERNGPYEPQLNLHCLRDWEFNATADKLGEERTKTNVPDVKLCSRIGHM
jgi:hypothetical protein